MTGDIHRLVAGQRHELSGQQARPWDAEGLG